MATRARQVDRAARAAPSASRRTPPYELSLTWIWVGCFCVSVGWLGLLPIYAAPHWSSAFFFLLAAALGMIALGRTEVAPLPREYLGLLLPLGLFTLGIPWPYHLGPLLLVASLLVLAAGERGLWLRRGAVALGGCGLLLLVEAVLQPLLLKVFVRSHGTAWAAEIVGLILRAVGAQVSVHGSVLHMQTFEELSPINVTWEALGCYVLACFGAGGLLLLCSVRATTRRWLAFCVLLLVYPLIRYPVVLLAYQESGRGDLFWSPWVLLLTFLPLPLLAGKYLARDARAPARVNWPPLVITRRTIAVLVSSCVATIGLIGACSFQDPGVRKQGRVLIDEAHSNWEWTTRKYDTTWYNEASGYNYYCLADFLGHFHQVARGTQEITPEVLKHYDVLILKTLTKPLQPQESDAIVEFVRGGGGLWLVGDHTNVFGISAHMNPLAKRFGLSYKYDATYDLTSGGLSVYRPSSMLPHPTVQHMPAVFLFGTSCSMDAGFWADYPIIGYGLKALRADYARENFFPEDKPTLDQEFGLLLQQVALRFGRGRVVAFTDSTVFSNFWFYMPGKSELCLGTINWLNRSNRWPPLRWLFGLIVIGTLGLLLHWSRGREWRALPVWLLAGILIGAPVGIRAFATWNRTTYSLPAPQRPLRRVAFERSHCSFTLPSEAMNQPMDNHYHTFFVWTQRLGYMPISVPSLKTALGTGGVAVFVNPAQEFSAQERQQMQRYLRAGGRVLVADGAHNLHSTANQLLEEYGIQIDSASSQQSYVVDQRQRRVLRVELPRAITGGTPLLKLDTGKPFLTALQVGKGTMAVMGNSELFTDLSMGVTSTVPNTTQRGIYDLEFWLFRNLMEGPSDPELWGLPWPGAKPTAAQSVRPSGVPQLTSAIGKRLIGASVGARTHHGTAADGIARWRGAASGATSG